jgi:ATP-dependent protease Clp ATPase subunit
MEQVFYLTKIYSSHSYEQFHAHWQVESGDLAKYGLIPEFIGRLPILVSLAALNEDQLVQVVLKIKSYLFIHIMLPF